MDKHWVVTEQLGDLSVSVYNSEAILASAPRSGAQPEVPHSESDPQHSGSPLPASMLLWQELSAYAEPAHSEDLVESEPSNDKITPGFQSPDLSLVADSITMQSTPFGRKILTIDRVPNGACFDEDKVPQSKCPQTAPAGGPKDVETVHEDTIQATDDPELLVSRSPCFSTTGFVPERRPSQILSAPTVRPLTLQEIEFPSYERQKNHRWTSDERLTVYVLKRWYSASVPSLWAVFKDMLQEANKLSFVVEETYNRRSFSAQYYDAGNYAGREDYEKVFADTPFTDPEGKWSHIRERAESSAARLSIDLQPRTEELHHTPLERPRKRERFMSVADSDEDSGDVNVQAPEPSREPTILPTIPSLHVSRPKIGRRGQVVGFWNLDHRRTICFLKKWYILSWEKLALVFNAIYTSDLPMAKIRAQFSELKKPRRQINSPWQALNSGCSFDDPSWAETKSKIQDGAATVGVLLRPRDPGDVYRTADIDNKDEQQRCWPPEDTQGRERTTATVLSDVSIMFSDNEMTGIEAPRNGQATSHTGQEPEEIARVAEKEAMVRTKSCVPTGSLSSLPNLFYRAFDQHSACVSPLSPGSFGGFRAGRYSEDNMLHVRLPAPLPPDCDFLTDEVFEHVWIRNPQRPTPFVSVTTSLVWAVKIASEKEAEGRIPYIAVIDAQNAAEGGNAYYAAPFVPKMKERKMAEDMRHYKASFEWLIWCEIPRAAIIAVVPFASLQELSAEVRSVNGLLRLNSFHHTRTCSIRKQLKADQLALSSSVGTGIARLALLFGLSASSPPDFIQNFTYNLVEGWAVDEEIDERIEDLEEISHMFLLVLKDGTKDAPISREHDCSLKLAFRQAVEAAFENERRWIRSLRTSCKQQAPSSARYNEGRDSRS